MVYNKYTKAEIIGSRKIPETVRGLVTDYCDIYTKSPDKLGFLTLEEAQKMNLTKSQKEVFYYVVNSNLRRLVSPQSGLKIRLDGRICPPGTVSLALKKLQQYNLVKTMNIVDYASFFAKYVKGGRPAVKFPYPLNHSFFDYLNYFTRTKGSSKVSIRKLFDHLGKMDKSSTLPRFSYARILYKGESLKRIFPKPKDFVPFHLYDVMMIS